MVVLDELQPAEGGLDEAVAHRGRNEGGERIDELLGVALRRRIRARRRDRRLAHRRVDAAGDEVRVHEAAREPPPVVKEAPGPAGRPERDARLVDVLEDAGQAERQVEGVRLVEERNRVGFPPRDGLPAEAQEEPPAGDVHVGFVDAKRQIGHLARVVVAAEHGIGLVGVDLPRVAELVGARDGRGVRASLGEARLQRLARPVVLAGAVVVDPVVEAPEREPEGDVVEAAREVRRELAFELWTHERAVRDQLERRATRHGLRLRVLRRERGLGVGAGAELEVVRVV